MESQHRGLAYFHNAAYTVDSADDPNYYDRNSSSKIENDDIPGFLSYTGNEKNNGTDDKTDDENQLREYSQNRIGNIDQIDRGRLKRSAENTYKSFGIGDDYPFVSDDTQSLERTPQHKIDKLTFPLKEQDNSWVNKSSGKNVSAAFGDLNSKYERNLQEENELDDNLENKMPKVAWENVKKAYFTMKNAKEIASHLGMLIKESEIKRQGLLQPNIDSVFDRTVKRKCWSRSCWSNDHVHTNRTRLQQTPVSPATGLSALELNKQKARRRLNETWKTFTNSIFIWSQSMKTIEGRYGTGVVSYFIFLRWLLLLNIFICILVFSFIVLPQIVNLKDMETTLSNKSEISIAEKSYSSFANFSNNECSELYKISVRNSTTVVERLQDLLQGTGFLEITALFPGFYSDKVPLAFMKLYNISLAYILVTLSYFLVCLIMMVIYTSEGVHEALKTSESQIQKYCNLVFGGWDYCIEEKKTATRKHQSIFQELKSSLSEKRWKDKISQWSRKTKILVFLTRCFVHTIVVAILGAGGYLIYFVSIKSTEMLNNTSQSDKLVFFLEFLPSITITLLSIILPIIFNIVTKVERYSISFTIKITLVRTVFVKLASVGVLVWTFYQQLFSCDSDDLDTEMCVPCNKNENKSVKCWETYVGQQIYKLVILDFFVVLITIFLIDYPRRLVYTKCTCKLAKIVGPLEFDIPKHVLDLVYSQTLCWLGTFYSPLLPVICVLKYLIFFYLKKLTLLVNCSPSQIPYRASRSNTFFMIVLMLSFVSSVIPVGYTIAKFSPSKGCGPFRYYRENMWEPVSVAVESINEPHVKDIINFIASASFAVPLIIILCLLIYYYLTVSSAHKEMISVLKDQLILEGKDKQFLLARLTEDARQRLRTGGSFN